MIYVAVEKLSTTPALSFQHFSGCWFRGNELLMSSPSIPTILYCPGSGLHFKAVAMLATVHTSPWFNRM